jgi:hypothetical protein
LLSPLLAIYPAFLPTDSTGLTTFLPLELLPQFGLHNTADMVEDAAAIVARLVPVEVGPPLALNGGPVFTRGLALGDQAQGNLVGLSANWAACHSCLVREEAGGAVGGGGEAAPDGHNVVSSNRMAGVNAGDRFFEAELPGNLREGES